MASFEPSTAFTLWKAQPNFAGGDPPVDLPRTIVRLLTIDGAAAVVCFVLATVCSMFAVASAGITMRYRKLRLVKLSSPHVNLTIALGCCLAYASCVAMATNGVGAGGVAICWAETCFLALGYSCAFGAMFAKTWRVHVIFTDKRIKRAIKDWHLFSIVGALLLLDALIFVLWALLDPMHFTEVHLQSEEDAEAGVINNWRIAMCLSSFSSVWQGVLIGKNGLILIFGIFFAWETRRVYVEALNDSKQIGICVYNTLIMGAIGLSLHFVLPSNQPTLNFALTTVCVFVCSTTALVLVFGSKILILLHHGPSRVDDQSVAIGAGAAGGSICISGGGGGPEGSSDTTHRPGAMMVAEGAETSS